MRAPPPTFADFYCAIHRRPPFPWQARLAQQVAETDQWPVEVGVPTGLGKTACLDIAVWWLATQAHRKPPHRTAPTRIWWVVNRRLLVDSTADHAERLAQTLSDPDAAGFSRQAGGIVAEVAERLRSLSADPAAAPLDVIRLRGGLASRAPSDPSRPTVLLCTLPMYGSRLLFRGYGSTLRPVDAAMAGTDSLVLLDEAHLAPHLRTLIPALAECTPGAEPILGEARSTARITALTATGDGSGERFDLDEEDEENPIIQRRLHAKKPLEVRRFETSDTARHLADAALDLLKEAPRPSACLVFANTPKTARKAFERLRWQMTDAEAEILLLTGLSREREAERMRARILDPGDGMAATRPAGLSRERHLVVVATQTLEVGADIDAEYLVTEACGVRALTQRLGRLNRFGHHDHARAAYVHAPPSQARRIRGGPSQESETWPVYGGEPKQVLQRLESACVGGERRVVDLPPARVAEVLGDPGDDPGRAPEILPGILREWTKTTSPPVGEALVEPYFSGIQGPEYAVSLMWRVHVPEGGERLWPRATDREVVDVPIGEVREVLREVLPDDKDLHRLAPDGVTVEVIAAALRPGDQIVLPADLGLLDRFGWNPAASEPVVDASLRGQGLPLDRRAIERLCGVDVAPQLKAAFGNDEHEEVDQAERAEAVRAILTQLREAETPPGWGEEEWVDFRQALGPPVEEAHREVPRLRGVAPEFQRLSSDFGNDLDETSLSPTAVELDEHGRAVGARARLIAERLGLAPALGHVVERAGALHDIGKADARFQRWLAPDQRRRTLVAKSDTPRHRWEASRAAAGWPRGGRHEDLSARLVRAWLEQHPSWGSPEERDLLLHLVISHHGKGRPLVPPVPDGTAVLVSAEVKGVLVEASADLAIVDWSQPRRFRQLNDRFGPWGLSLLEAIVRLADHAVSAGAYVAEEMPQ